METQSPVFHLPIDPLTGLGTRQCLFVDLAPAVLRTATPSVLAIFDLAGFKDFQRAFGTQAAEDLVAELSAIFRTALGELGMYYRPREDEFVTLIDAPQEAAKPLLVETVAELRKAGEKFMITTSFGMALLPDEADEPIVALAVADQRLQAVTGRGPRTNFDALRRRAV